MNDVPPMDPLRIGMVVPILRVVPAHERGRKIWVGLKLAKRLEAEIMEVDAVAKFTAGGCSTENPRISGGQRQQGAIGRTISASAGSVSV